MDRNEARELAEALVEDLNKDFERIADRLLSDVDETILAARPDLDEDEFLVVSAHVLDVILKRFLPVD